LRRHDALICRHPGERASERRAAVNRGDSVILQRTRDVPGQGSLGRRIRPSTVARHRRHALKPGLTAALQIYQAVIQRDWTFAPPRTPSPENYHRCRLPRLELELVVGVTVITPRTGVAEYSNKHVCVCLSLRQHISTPELHVQSSPFSCMLPT